MFRHFSSTLSIGRCQFVKLKSETVTVLKCTKVFLCWSSCCTSVKPNPTSVREIRRSETYWRLLLHSNFKTYTPVLISLFRFYFRYFSPLYTYYFHLRRLLCLKTQGYTFVILLDSTRNPELSCRLIILVLPLWDVSIEVLSFCIRSGKQDYFTDVESPRDYTIQDTIRLMYSRIK